MNANVVLRELRDPSDEQLLGRFYDEILVPYFSPGELVPLDALQRALGPEPCDTEIVVANDNGAVIGGAVGDWDADSRVYLLSYLAVRSSERSRGVGTLLMGHVRSWWEARGASVVLAEVDDPRHHAVSDYGDPDARLRFYDRLGARLLAISYTQPEVRSGTGRMPGMLLITFQVRAEARAGDAMRVDVLRRFLANYLVLCEGTVADQVDAAVNSLAPALTKLSTIPILPMSDYHDI